MFSFPITATLPAFAMMATLLTVGGQGNVGNELAIFFIGS